jgi:hypothetical protein
MHMVQIRRPTHRRWRWATAATGWAHSGTVLAAMALGLGLGHGTLLGHVHGACVRDAPCVDAVRSARGWRLGRSCSQTHRSLVAWGHC